VQPRLGDRLSVWIQRLPATLGGRERAFGGLLESRLKAGDSLQKALQGALPVLGANAVAQALKAEDGPVALVCVDLVSSLKNQLQRASSQLSQVKQPWALWTSSRLKMFSAALEKDVVNLHLVNAVLAEAAVASELSPVVVRTIGRQALEKRVVQVLVGMRSTIFTPTELLQTTSTLGARRRLADIRDLR
jgi:hypothetical protein